MCKVLFIAMLYIILKKGAENGGKNTLIHLKHKF